MLQNILTSDGYSFEQQTVAVLEVLFFTLFCLAATLVVCGAGYLLCKAICFGYRTLVSMISWDSLGSRYNHLKCSIYKYNREMSEAVCAAIKALSIGFLVCFMVALPVFPLVDYGISLRGLGAIAVAGLLLGVLVALCVAVHGLVTKVKCMQVVGRAALCIACGPVAMVLFFSFLIALSSG